MLRGAASPRLQEIIDLCRAAKVHLRFESRESLDRMVPGLPHQGVVAHGAAHGSVSLDDVIGTPGLLVALDGVEDPHNLGAVIRTAHAAGANAVIIPERRAAGLTETVAKSAAGALALLPVVRSGNLAQTLEKLKQAGFWIYGLDERGSTVYTDTEFDERTVVVMGGEGHGLHDLIRKRCDFLLRIPMAGQIASLNVSVATGVVLFEWRRKRTLKVG
jgi:23S rRNA (guanosine2251-2'-O)-methyltransferase